MRFRLLAITCFFALVAACTTSNNDTPGEVPRAVPGSGDDGNDSGKTKDGGGDDGSAGDDAGDDEGDGGGTPEVQFIGRVDDSDPYAVLAAWPGVRAVARFNG